MRFRSPRIVQSPHSCIETHWLPTRRAPAQRWPIYSGHSISSIIRADFFKHMYATHLTRQTLSPAACFYRTYYMSAAHSSVRLGQHFFGETTPRPLAHAASEGPRKSFWGYVGHWCPSSGCCHDFCVSCVSLSFTTVGYSIMPYLKTVISVK
jgi:hypothetical protein